MLLDDIFWLSMAIVFVAALVGAVVRHRNRDRCLKLFAGQDVTLVFSGGKTIWGDLLVYGKSLELVYPQPATTEHGFVKRSFMVPSEEIGAVYAISRWAGGLSAAEREAREVQVRRLAHPGLGRRLVRWLRNLVNSISDAFSQAVSMFVGRMAIAGPKPLADQKGRVSEVGHTLVGVAARAFEPMLERHIGRPVVIEVQNPKDGDGHFELRGFLAEYTESYIALVTTDQSAADTLEWTSDADIDREDLLCTCAGGVVRIENRSPVPLVVKCAVEAGTENTLGLVLLLGATTSLGPFDGSAAVRMVRGPHVDAVFSRKVARVRHASA